MFLRSLRGSAASALQRMVRHPVMRAAGGFAALTSVVKALAFVKEAVVAGAFGVGSSMDSYLMALVVIGFPSGVLINAAQTVLIREYVQILEAQGERAAAGFLRSAMLAMLAVLTAVLIVWLVALQAILAVIGHGLAPGVRSLVSANVYQLVPYYYLNSINLLGYGALQSRKAFLRAGLIPAATPLCVMALVAAAGADLRVLISALTAGTMVETALILLPLKDSLRLFPRAAARARPAVREFVLGTLFLAPGTLVSGLLPVIEQTIASGLRHGTISALGYAAKLPATLNSLLTGAVGVTVLPYFARRLLSDDAESCRRFFIRYVALVTLSGAVIALVAVLGSGPFVRLAFQRGQFSEQDALLVASLQRAYLWQLPGALAGMAALRFVAAQGRYRAMSLGNLLIVPLTGLLQWLLSVRWGGVGLAFGISVGTALSAVIFCVLALRRPSAPSTWRTSQ